MKSLEDSVSLVGEVEVITATDLRKNIGQCLTQVDLGKTYCIKRKGKIVAFMVKNADIRHQIEPDGTCKTLRLVGDLGPDEGR
jgi:antitoxin (DNA-binding transcriptional repressor) of toxin-antitoxin stability system